MLMLHGTFVCRDAGAGETEVRGQTSSDNRRRSVFWRPERPENVQVSMYDSGLAAYSHSYLCKGRNCLRSSISSYEARDRQHS